jgi:hypothetical protein
VAAEQVPEPEREQAPVLDEEPEPVRAMDATELGEEPVLERVTDATAMVRDERAMVMAMTEMAMDATAQEREPAPVRVTDATVPVPAMAKMETEMDATVQAPVRVLAMGAMVQAPGPGAGRLPEVVVQQEIATEQWPKAQTQRESG